MLSNFEPMRTISILAVILGAMPILAATPEIAPTPTVPVAAAEQGKDVVHQLNNAFAKVFETVAPSVVIIEISKKSDTETSAFEDLFFQGPPDESNPRRDRKSTRLNSSHGYISYAVFCLKKKSQHIPCTSLYQPQVHLSLCLLLPCLL